MSRVAAPGNASEFIDTVIGALRVVEPVSDEVVYARFRRSRACENFRELLKEAALPPGARILCIGCGPRLAGRSAAYASMIVREIYPGANPERLDIDRLPHDFEGGPYDGVVTHSLLHFIYDPVSVCEFIQRLIAPGGVYVMANEPNARFWANPACVSELRRVDAQEAKRRRLRRYVSPSRYWSRLVRVVSTRKSTDPFTAMNRLLRQRLGIVGDLKPKEIVRLVDPHQPDPHPGDFSYGRDGLTWCDLAAGMRLESVRTSGYVMRDNPLHVPDRWREIDAKLAAEYPLDGCSFSALWRK